MTEASALALLARGCISFVPDLLIRQRTQQDTDDGSQLAAIHGEHGAIQDGALRSFSLPSAPIREYHCEHTFRSTMDGDHQWQRESMTEGSSENQIEAIVLDRPLELGRSLEQLNEEFGKALSTWKRSSCREEFLQVLDKRRPLLGWQFTKVVCLATGSPSSETEISTCRKQRSIPQLVCAIDLASQLRERGHAQNSTIEIFAQDPCHTNTDIAFLSSQGVTVLDTKSTRLEDTRGLGVARHHFGPQTLAIEFGIPKWDQYIVKELYGPEVGMNIGHGFHALRQRAAQVPHYEPDLLIAEDFDRRYTSQAFPPSEEFGDPIERFVDLLAEATSLQQLAAA